MARSVIRGPDIVWLDSYLVENQEALKEKIPRHVSICLNEFDQNQIEALSIVLGYILVTKVQKITVFDRLGYLKEKQDVVNPLVVQKLEEAGKKIKLNSKNNFVMNGKTIEMEYIDETSGLDTMLEFSAKRSKTASKEKTMDFEKYETDYY